MGIKSTNRRESYYNYFGDSGTDAMKPYDPDLPLSSKVKVVVSLYDVSDDWIPIYDKSDLPGFYMAVCSSGNQYKNAPIAGVMMTELIEACEKGQNHDQETVKLHLKYINREIDIGFYSRNRLINSESSMSVLG